MTRLSEGSSRGFGIVVVHHGSPEPLVRCLRSIHEDPSPVARRVVVVDNTPGGGVSVEALDPDTGDEVVRPTRNLGFGGGANLGVEGLRTAEDLDGFVVLNHDVELLPGFLEAASRALREPGVAAVCGPLHLDRPDGPLWYAGGEVRWLTGTVRQSRSPEAAARARDVGFLTGAALAVSARAWDEVGGFDPGFFLYHEDLDLCLRLRRAGWRLRFEPGMRAVHHLGAATGSRGRSAFYLEHMTKTRFRPYRSRLYRAYLALLHAPFVALRSLLLLRREGRDGLPKAKALLRGYRQALGTVWTVDHRP